MLPSRRDAAWVVALFVALGLLYTVQSYFQQIANGVPEPFWLLARRQLAVWGVRAALAPLVFAWCGTMADLRQSLARRGVRTAER